MQLSWYSRLVVMITALCALPLSASAQPIMGTAFTYQGQLRLDDAPLNDGCDFKFWLYDDEFGGSSWGPQEVLDYLLSNGLFTIPMDFGISPFSQDRELWLEIAIRYPSGSGSYVTLPDRQRITPTPLALLSSNADRLDGHPGSEYALDAEVLTLVWDNDGPGSGLNADYLDGFSSEDFIVGDLCQMILGCDGSGSGLDADLLDGLEGTEFVILSDLWSLILQFDGPGSSLDADLLDGLSSGDFTQDNEVFGIVLNNDGPGSGLDADTLDGRSSGDFFYSAGTGLSGSGSTVSLNSSYTDGRYVQEGESNSISRGMVQNNAIDSSKLASDSNSLFPVSGGVMSSDGSKIMIGGSTGLNTKLFVTGSGNTIYAETGSSSYAGIVGRHYRSSGGPGVAGAANNSNWFYLDEGNGVSGTGNKFGVFGYATYSGSSGQAGGYFSNGAGDFAYVAYRSTGGTSYKIYGSGAVSTDMPTSNGHVSLICPESPEAWFEDFGSGVIQDGRAHIALDPMFLECVTINTEHPLKVFIELTSPLSKPYYIQKRPTGFDVVVIGGAAGDYSFDYRVVCKWKGMENVRFEQAPGPADARVFVGDSQE